MHFVDRAHVVLCVVVCTCAATISSAEQSHPSGAYPDPAREVTRSHFGSEVGVLEAFNEGRRERRAAASHCSDVGQVVGETKISATAGGFAGSLGDGAWFGTGIAVIGDLNGDGISEIAVGSQGLSSPDGSLERAVWVLFLQPDGSVTSEQKIANQAGGFAGQLTDGSVFGSAMTGIGDLDGDGVPDLAVGAAGSAEGGIQRGAVWILLLRSDGTVKSEQKISGMARWT